MIVEIIHIVTQRYKAEEADRVYFTLYTNATKQGEGI